MARVGGAADESGKLGFDPWRPGEYLMEIIDALVTEDTQKCLEKTIISFSILEGPLQDDRRDPAGKPWTFFLNRLLPGHAKYGVVMVNGKMTESIGDNQLAAFLKPMIPSGITGDMDLQEILEDLIGQSVRVKLKIRKPTSRDLEAGKTDPYNEVVSWRPA